MGEIVLDYIGLLKVDVVKLFIEYFSFEFDVVMDVLSFGWLF